MNVFEPLGSTGLHCHRLGFGCYRVVDGATEHEAALRRYLGRGGNLIDTSANYGDGASEALVGKVLHGVPRERVIVVTKGGYIQGQNMTLAQQRDFPDVVQYGPGIWHSIHREFLQSQIERSLARLERDYIDVYLLHNPEYFLEDIAHRRELTAGDHDEFYRRVREAFHFLEEQVRAGVIGWYGVSSNNFGQPAWDPARLTAATSVARCLAEAETVSREHHFRVVQLPLNLYEPGGAVEANNNGSSVLTFCRDKGLGVLANRPLNAFSENQLVRLADWAEPGSSPPGMDALREMVVPLAELESRLPEAAGATVRLASGETVSELFQRVLPQVQSLDHWRHVAGRNIVEPLEAWLKEAGARHERQPGWRPWYEEFVRAVNSLLQDVPRYLRAQQQPQSDAVRARLLAAGYPPGHESLSRMALHVLAGLEGLSSILVGMRQPSYVDDALGIIDFDVVDGRAILRRFN